MMRRGRDQRGLSESTQWAVLWPLVLLVSLGIIQAGIYLHGRNVAQRAATAAVDAARGSYGSVAEARQFAEGIARSGGLRSVSISINRGPDVGDRRRSGRSGVDLGHRSRPAPRDGSSASGEGQPAMISRTRAMRERGAVAAELAVVIPALILMLGMIIAGGRLWFARTTVVEAAQTAARAASLERSAGPALAAGREAGDSIMSTAGLNCSSSSISVDTAAFGVPAGVPATVNATVRCSVRLGDLGLPVLPGSTDVTGRRPRHLTPIGVAEHEEPSAGSREASAASRSPPSPW